MSEFIIFPGRFKPYGEKQMKRITSILIYCLLLLTPIMGVRIALACNDRHCQPTNCVVVGDGSAFRPIEPGFCAKYSALTVGPERYCTKQLGEVTVEGYYTGFSSECSVYTSAGTCPSYQGEPGYYDRFRCSEYLLK